MGQDPGQERAAVEQPTPEQLRRDIAQTRADLGDTAAALAQKTDVKARAKDKVEDIKESATDKAESLKQAAADKKGGGIAAQAKAKAQDNPVITAAGAAFLGGFLLGRLRSR
jgi:ABC-type transporter Mla subunit MlaD